MAPGQEAGRQPTTTPKSSEGWHEQPHPLKGQSRPTARSLLVLAHLAERGMGAVSSKRRVAGDGINSRFQNKKMLVHFRLISYPVAAKSASTLAVSVGCMGKGEQFPKCKPSAPSAGQGSIPQAKGLRLLTSPCYAVLQVLNDHK